LNFSKRVGASFVGFVAAFSGMMVALDFDVRFIAPLLSQFGAAKL
jgi:hypothetical protein